MTAGQAPSRRYAGTAVVAMVLIWGTTWAAIRIGLEGIPPVTGVALRFAIAGALLWGYALALGLRGATLRAPAGLWLVHGVCSFCVSYGIVYWAEQWVPSSLTAVLFATFPLFVAVMAHWVLPGERLGRRSATGLLLGFLGVAVIFSEDFRALGGPQVAFASAVLLLAPFASAIANVAIKRWGGAVHPVPLNAGGMVLAAAVMGALAWAVEADRTVVFDARSLGALLYLAVLGTAVTFTLYFELLRHTSATRLSLVAYAIPVVAVVVGAVAFAEPITPRMVAGGALVIAGTALVATPRRVRSAHPAVG
ncbi:MAG TPA: DMT family transporter [Thermoanaerobaculia bacterium]|nr:DMT family transporter [Thermoanaerobaculia bacterium]